MAAYTRNRIVKNEVNCGKATSILDTPIRSQARLGGKVQRLFRKEVLSGNGWEALRTPPFTEGDDIVHTHMKIWDTV